MEPKRLFRSKKDRIIGGVCGGLGNYFNVDPVIIRVVTVAMFFAGFLGLLGYIIAWIIVPEDPAV
jgi:phage shock protein C